MLSYGKAYHFVLCENRLYNYCANSIFITLSWPLTDRPASYLLGVGEIKGLTTQQPACFETGLLIRILIDCPIAQ